MILSVSLQPQIIDDLSRIETQACFITVDYHIFESIIGRKALGIARKTARRSTITGNFGAKPEITGFGARTIVYTEIQEIRRTAKVLQNPLTA
jgi:hypothetical protein